MKAKMNKEQLIINIQNELKKLVSLATDKFTKQLVISLINDCEKNNYKIEITFNKNLILLKRNEVSMMSFEKKVNNYFDSERCCDLYNNNNSFGENDFALFKNLINEGLVFIE